MSTRYLLNGRCSKSASAKAHSRCVVMERVLRSMRSSSSQARKKVRSTRRSPVAFPDSVLHRRSHATPGGRQNRDRRRGDSGLREDMEKFFREKYLPASRDTSMRHLGYAERTRVLSGAQHASTTTKSRPDEIHQIGLAEVARDSRRDERGDPRSRLQGHVRRVPEVPPHRSGLLSQDAGGAAERVRSAREADRSGAPAPVPDAAAHAIRRAPHPGDERAEHNRRRTARAPPPMDRARATTA